MKPKIVIWGYGRFGALFHQILAEHFTQFLNQKLLQSHEALMAEYASDEMLQQRLQNNPFVPTTVDLVVVSSRELSGVVQQDLVTALKDATMLIMAMPISDFSSSLDKVIALPEVNPDLIVVDVCSVKLHPATEMQSKLSKTHGIIATHPMWGPDSTENGTKLADLKFIYKILRHNGSMLIDLFINFWEELGQEVIELSPDEHDRQAAYTHAFAFLIGKMGMKMEVRRNQISTKGFEGILYNQKAVENDSGELFRNMFTYNPYAKEMLAKFQQTVEQISADLYS